MTVESEESNGSKLINTKLRNRPIDKNTHEVPAANMVSKETLSAVEEDPSKSRKTFGRTPDGKSNQNQLPPSLISVSWY